VSAQASARVAMLEEHDCITPLFVPKLNDIPAIERLIDPETRRGPEIRAAPSLMGCSWPGWKLVLLTDANFGQQSLGTSGTCGGAQAAKPHRSIPATAARRLRWCTATTASAALLKLEKIWRISSANRDYLVVHTRRPPWGWLARPARAARAATGPARRPNPISPAWAAVAWSRAKERALKYRAQGGASIFVSSSMPNATKGPRGFASRRWPPGSLEWRFPSPYEAHPQTSRRISEVKRDMEKTSDGPAVFAAMWAFRQKPKLGDPGLFFKGGDSRQGRPPCRSHTVLAQQHWAPPEDERFRPYQSRWPLLTLPAPAATTQAILEGAQGRGTGCVCLVGTTRLLGKGTASSNFGLAGGG